MREWEANIKKTVPYVPGSQPKGSHIIKLNTNENPYPPPPGVKEALKEMNYGLFRKYPDPSISVLVDALAEYYKRGKDEIFVGVGSDDVIAMSFLTFFNSGRPVLFPDVTYSFYPVWAELFGVPYKRPALEEGFAIRKEDYYGNNGGIIFPNPNAPTGVYMPLSEVEEIVSNNQDVIVIVDEAYIDFGGESAISLTRMYENLLVVQTFSKSRSMAGMRIGYAIGNPLLIRALNDVKHSYNSYTMNMPSQILGAKAVEEEAYFKSTSEKIIHTREREKIRLRGLGFAFPDSMANFIYASHKSVRAKDIYKALWQNKIYVRYFDQPRIDNHLRITIGTDDEMEALYCFLKGFL